MKPISIKKKTFISICSLTTLALSILGLILYTQSLHILKENKVSDTIDSCSKIKQNVEFFLREIENTVTLLSSNEIVQNELRKASESSNENQYVIQNEVYTLLSNAISVQEYLKDVYIISNNGNFYSSNLRIQKSALIDKLKRGGLQDISILDNDKKNLASYYFTSDSDTIFYVKRIDKFSSDNKLGIIIVELNYNYLREILTISSIPSKNKVIIINSEGKIVFNYPSYSTFDDVIDENPELLTIQKAQLNRLVFGNDSIIVSDTIAYSGWKLINIISTDKIYSDVSSLKKVAIYISLFFIILSLIIALILSSSFTRPILELNKKIKLVEKGDLTTRIDVKREDELGQLCSSFNNMTIKLGDLIDKQLYEQKQKSELEFQILQAQINPHFLYNTLDTVKWMAIIQNVPNIGDALTSLINLLKFNISRNTINVTLNEEIQSVENYINLQKYKYGDIFSVNYNIQENTVNCVVLRFILQPLVENAIFHAFESGKRNGVIKIKSKIKENMLIIVVVDNGVGIDKRDLVNLTHSRNQKRKFSNIGLKNINDRIKLYFGEKYGMSISSKLNYGTKVTITLPVIYENA